MRRWRGGDVSLEEDKDVVDSGGSIGEGPGPLT